jgi:beta-porphyranase
MGQNCEGSAQTPGVGLISNVLDAAAIHLYPIPLILAAMSMLGWSTPGAAEPPAAPSGEQWVPVPELTDNFSTFPLDPQKWKVGSPSTGWPGRRPSRFIVDNVFLSHDALALRTTALVSSLDSIHDPNVDVWLGAACVSSVAPIARYGYYEARLKTAILPTTSSFWLQGHYSEIDVVEGVGEQENWFVQTPNQMHSSTHYFPQGWKNDHNTTQFISMNKPDTEWHVYGVWWKDATTAWYYLDGVKVSEQHFAGAFDEPMYLYLDTEPFLREGLPTLADLSDPGKNTMYVKWVRAYHLAPIGMKK